MRRDGESGAAVPARAKSVGARIGYRLEGMSESHASAPVDTTREGESEYDLALARFHAVDLEYGPALRDGGRPGFANHGPMAVEALESIGHAAKIPALVDLYAPRLPPAPPPGDVLDEAERDASLADFARRADWVATFEAVLSEGDWRSVLVGALGELLPGLFAAAGHGLIRTAHAVRALERSDGPLRRRELARGLAHWAARYRPLPGLPGSLRAGEGAAAKDPGTRLAAWPVLGAAADRDGTLCEVVEQLDRDAAFRSAVETTRWDESIPFDAMLAALARAAAQSYVASPQARVAFAHGVTLAHAWRTVARHLPRDLARRGLDYLFQAVAALYTIYRDPGSSPAEDAEVLRIAEDWAEIRYHAACSLEEHAIKMVEACWREDQASPDAVFRRAAADAALSIDGRGRASIC